MKPLSFAHDEAVPALACQIEPFLAAADAFNDLDLLDPSLCRGWSRLDLVVHVCAGLEEMAAERLLGASHRQTPMRRRTGGRTRARDADPVDGILWLRRVASAYRRPRHALEHLKDVAVGVINTIHVMPPCVVASEAGS